MSFICLQINGCTFRCQIRKKVYVTQIYYLYIYYKKNLKNIVDDFNKIKTRKNKVSFTETVIYSLLYTEINKSKREVIINLNVLPEYNNNFTKEKFKRTTLYEKESLIPIDYYVDIFQKIKEIYENLFKNDNNNKIIVIDCTYNNTNVYNIKGFLETSLSLNMGFFDIYNEIPLDFTFCGLEKIKI